MLRRGFEGRTSGDLACGGFSGFGHDLCEPGTCFGGSLLRYFDVSFALQSGFESYVPKTRVVLFEAAIAARYGCTFAEALRMITIDAARLLEIDGRVGSLEVGKDADLALFDGDPFEYTSHCVGVIIEGRLESDLVR